MNPRSRTVVARVTRKSKTAKVPRKSRKRQIDNGGGERILKNVGKFGYVNSENPDIYSYESIVKQYVAIMKEDGLDFIPNLIRTLAYIVNREGRLLTVCSLIVEPNNDDYSRVYVMGLITPKMYRKKGYASMLLSEIQKDAVKNNMYEVYLRVDADKLHLLRPFYESNGFVYGGRNDFYYKNTEFDVSNVKYQSQNVYDTKFKVLDDLVFDSRYSLFYREEISDKLVLHEYTLNNGYIGLRLIPEYNKNIRGLKYDYENNYENMDFHDDGMVNSFRQIIVFNRLKRRVEIACCYEITSYNSSVYGPCTPYESIIVRGYIGGDGKNREFIVSYLNRMWNGGKDLEDYSGVGDITFTEEGYKKVILYDVKRYEELSAEIVKNQEEEDRYRGLR